MENGYLTEKISYFSEFYGQVVERYDWTREDHGTTELDFVLGEDGKWDIADHETGEVYIQMAATKAEAYSLIHAYLTSLADFNAA